MPDLKTALASVIHQWERNQIPELEPVQPTVQESNTVFTTTTSTPSPTPAPTPILRPSTMTAPPVYDAETNISRVAYKYAVDNGGHTRAEIVNALISTGFPKGSATSVLSRMIIQGLAEERNGKFYALVKDYVPLKSGEYLAKMRKQRIAAARRAATRAANQAAHPVRTDRELRVPRVDREPREPRVLTDYLPPDPPVLQNVTTVPVEPPKFELTADYIVKHVSLAEAKRLYEELGQYFK